MTRFEYRRQTAGEVELDEGGTTQMFDIPDEAVGITLFEFGGRATAKFLLPVEQSDRVDEQFLFENDGQGDAP